MTESSVALAFSILPKAIWETLYMVFVSAFFASLVGLPIGITLFLTAKEHTRFYKILGTIVNVVRSFPFAILLIVVIPFTRLIVGTSLGTTASVVPLSIALAPYLGRVVETALLGVDSRLIEAAIVMGSTRLQVIWKVLLPESLPSMIASFTVAIVNLVGYSAMAGLVGGGGLGSVAIQYGYQRFNALLMFWTVALLILIVGGIQWLGNVWARALLRKRGIL